jgi:hypothetical protein
MLKAGAIIKQYLNFGELLVCISKKTVTLNLLCWQL